MRILLVEDEEHKIEDLIERIQSAGAREHELHIVSGVRDAVLRVVTGTFDLVVLDMALPTFSKGGASGGEGGVAQAVGGVEVLRALEAAGKRCKVIIVTQYPDVFIGGLKIKLVNMPKVISEKYKQDVVGAILYQYNNPAWVKAFDAVLERIR